MTTNLNERKLSALASICENFGGTVPAKGNRKTQQYDSRLVTILEAIANAPGAQNPGFSYWPTDYTVSEDEPEDPSDNSLWEELNSDGDYLNRWLYSASLTRWLTADIYRASFSYGPNATSGAIVIPLPLFAIATTSKPTNPGVGSYALPSNQGGTAYPVITSIRPVGVFSDAGNSNFILTTTDTQTALADAGNLTAEQTWSNLADTGGSGYFATAGLVAGGGVGILLEPYSFLKVVPDAGTITYLAGNLTYRYARPTA